MPYLPNSGSSNGFLSPNEAHTHSIYRLSEENKKSNRDWKFYRTPIIDFGKRINLYNLERCDFITRLSQYGNKTRNSLFRLTDFFTLFYYKFIEPNNTKDERWWSNNIDSRSVLSWMGLGFELVCLSHHKQIKIAWNCRSRNICFHMEKQGRFRKRDSGVSNRLDYRMCRPHNPLVRNGIQHWPVRYHRQLWVETQRTYRTVPLGDKE